METAAQAAARIEERNRVDKFMAQKLVEYRASNQQQSQFQDQYPPGVTLMGPGFRNLYDVLGGKQMQQQSQAQ
jgi:hypothetical protein